MGRHSCCYKQKLRKGLWSPEEDEKLLKHITEYGHGCWSSVPKQAGKIYMHAMQEKGLMLSSFMNYLIAFETHFVFQACRGVARAAG